MIDWQKYDHLLGNIPDGVIARRIGCHINTVADRRMRLGIPSRAVLGPSRPFQLRMPLALLERLCAEDRRRVDAGWPSSVSGVIRDALEAGLPLLGERAV